MNKNILTEQLNSNFQIIKDKPVNVLKRIKGVVSDSESNRNGRTYPLSLWKNVIDSDYVKEMINNHSLFGEADHPETRLEISLQNVSHAINDLWIENGKVMAIIDILPTPMGKIISELLEYGTNLGISSRGAGTVLSDNSVDPEDYQFVTFDFVARPSCAAARLNTILESATVEASKTSDDNIKSLLEDYHKSLNENDIKDIENYKKELCSINKENLIENINLLVDNGKISKAILESIVKEDKKDSLEDLKESYINETVDELINEANCGVK